MVGNSREEEPGRRGREEGPAHGDRGEAQAPGDGAKRRAGWGAREGTGVIGAVRCRGVGVGTLIPATKRCVSRGFS